MITKPKTRRERIAAVLANIPDDVGRMPDGELDQEEIAARVEQDGKVLLGREWIHPEDYQDDDIEAGRLPSLKGMTDVTLPTLGEPTG